MLQEISAQLRVKGNKDLADRLLLHPRNKGHKGLVDQVLLQALINQMLLRAHAHMCVAEHLTTKGYKGLADQLLLRACKIKNAVE